MQLGRRGVIVRPAGEIAACLNSTYDGNHSGFPLDGGARRVSENRRCHGSREGGWTGLV